jgi:hypothetical protein
MGGAQRCGPQQNHTQTITDKPGGFRNLGTQVAICNWGDDDGTFWNDQLFYEVERSADGTATLTAHLLDCNAQSGVA